MDTIAFMACKPGICIPSSLVFVIQTEQRACMYPDFNRDVFTFTSLDCLHA